MTPPSPVVMNLVELQAEGTGVTERAEPLPAERRTGRLADVLDEGEPTFACDARECVHVGRRAPHVHGQDRSRLRRDLPFDIRGVERQRVVDVGENRHGADGDDGVRGGVPGVGGDDHLVAGATPAPTRPQMSADEPALTISACFAPRCAANSRSKSSTSCGPSPTP